MKKKVLACVLSGILAVSIFGCGSKSMMATESAVADSAAYDDMAYDSAMTQRKRHLRRKLEAVL